MLKSRLLLALVLIGIVSHSFAFACLGNCEFGQEKVDSIYAAGNVKLANTTVADGVQVAGNITANNAHMKTLKVAGETTLDNTVIEDKTEIAGNVIANGSTFSQDVVIAAMASFTSSKLNNGLKIAGKAELVNTRVVGPANFAGYLVAKRSVFDDSVTVASEKAIFTGSTLNKDLTIESKDKTPIVELICGTTVKGIITFKDKAGIVKVEQPDKMKLTIKHGKLEKAEKVNCSK